MKDNSVLGLDIGGTYIRAGMVDRSFALSDFVIESSAALFSEPHGPIEALANYVRGYCGRFLAGGKPAAVSIGFPSTVNKAKTILLSTPNLPNLDNLEVVGPLQQQLGVPVFIDRDVNLLLAYDILDNGLDTSGIIIGYYAGTGLGNAVMIEGKILTGKNGVAAELGHVPVRGVDRVCGCGNIGCMETVMSGRRLEELAEANFPGEGIKTLFTLHGKDPLVRDYVDWLAVPVATEVNIFDPDYVILGGGVLQMPDFPVEDLMASLHRYTRKPLPDEELQVLFSAGRQESGVVGAGMRAFGLLGKEG